MGAKTANNEHLIGPIKWPDGNVGSVHILNPQPQHAEFQTLNNNI